MQGCDANSHLLDARAYMRSISLHGLDVSALYIAQAYLTKLQASLKPTLLLLALFSPAQLAAVRQVCGCVGGSGEYNQGFEPLLKYFKAGRTLEMQPSEHSTTEVAHLMVRILDSLEEWDAISARAQRLAERADAACNARKESIEARRLEESLDAFLGKILQANSKLHTAESLNQTSQTCSIAIPRHPSSSSISHSEAEEEPVEEPEVAVFLGYVSMWMRQTLGEISELKAILELAKSESSVDHCRPPKKEKISKSSLLTSKIRQGQLDVPHIHNNFFDENITPVATRSARDRLKSEMSFRTQQERGRAVLGELGANAGRREGDGGRREGGCGRRRGGEGCSSCAVY